MKPGVSGHDYESKFHRNEIGYLWIEILPEKYPIFFPLVEADCAAVLSEQSDGIKV